MESQGKARKREREQKKFSRNLLRTYEAVAGMQYGMTKKKQLVMVVAVSQLSCCSSCCCYCCSCDSFAVAFSYTKRIKTEDLMYVAYFEEERALLSYAFPQIKERNTENIHISNV